MARIFKRKTIEYDGIKALLEWKNVMYIRLRVKADGQLYISVPIHVEEEQVKHAIEERRDWIMRHQLKHAHQPTQAPPKGWLETDHIMVWGERFDFKIEHTTGQMGVSLDDQQRRATASIFEYGGEPMIKLVMEDWYKSLTMAELRRILPRCEQTVGKQARSFRIRAMKTRWGSCGIANHSISLNLELAKLPKGCLELVLIHELTHLHVPNHSKEFYLLMDRFMPDWRQYDAQLKDHRIYTID